MAINTTVRQNVSARLFCFPYAEVIARIICNGDITCHRRLTVCPSNYPGAGKRIRKEPFVAFSVITEIIEEFLRPFLDVPFALFGRTMAALLAF
jgi:medium-chain acyl-[acyl-carrier-protein] hydrolase